MPALPRQYELVYIVHPNISDEAVQTVIAKYSNIITTQGGTIERNDIWERRRLAYQIAGQTEGIYVVCLFRGLPNVEAELRRVFRISEDTIRFIIVRPDEEIDASQPSIQPRDFSASRPPYQQNQPSGMIQPNAPASVQATAAAVASETPTSGDTPGAAAGTSTSIAAAAEAAGVPGMAAADEGQEVEGTPNPVNIIPAEENHIG